jgi:hypothetical protein
VWLLNSSVKWISAFPFALIDNVSISFTDLLALYGVVITSILFFTIKKRHYFSLSLSFIIAFLVLNIVKEQERKSQREFVVYDIKGTSAMGMLKGEQVTLLCDSLLSNNPQMIVTHLKPHWIAKGVKHSYNLVTGTPGFKNFIFSGKRIAFVHGAMERSRSVPCKVDYLVIGQSTKFDGTLIKTAFSPGLVIFDSSNRIKDVAKWCAECSRLNVNCYVVSRQGAFVKKL